MTDKIIVVDFSATLTSATLAEEANAIRCKKLGISPPDEAEHKKQHGTKTHYDIIKQRIGEIYGITNDMKIPYVQNRGEEIMLTGNDMKTIIMTDMFRDANFQLASEKGMDIFTNGFCDVLKHLQDKGYKLAIVSGTRTDIIAGILAIAKAPVTFDYIFGQDPLLTRDDTATLLKRVAEHGDILYIIGDKMSDLEPAKHYGAKTIFVTWGHPTGGESAFADYVVDTAKEIDQIIS